MGSVLGTVFGGGVSGGLSHYSEVSDLGETPCPPGTAPNPNYPERSATPCKPVRGGTTAAADTMTMGTGTQPGTFMTQPTTTSLTTGIGTITARFDPRRVGQTSQLLAKPPPGALPAGYGTTGVPATMQPPPEGVPAMMMSSDVSTGAMSTTTKALIGVGIAIAAIGVLYAIVKLAKKSQAQPAAVTSEFDEDFGDTSDCGCGG